MLYIPKGILQVALEQVDLERTKYPDDVEWLVVASSGVTADVSSGRQRIDGGRTDVILSSDLSSASSHHSLSAVSSSSLSSRVFQFHHFFLE